MSAICTPRQTGYQPFTPRQLHQPVKRQLITVLDPRKPALLALTALLVAMLLYTTVHSGGRYSTDSLSMRFHLETHGDTDSIAATVVKAARQQLEAAGGASSAPGQSHGGALVAAPQRAAYTKLGASRQHVRQQQMQEFAHFVRGCKGFDCLRKQADMEPAPGQFRFPHFYLIGFQKCATTSLYRHLILHPQIQEPAKKEPEFFTKTCEYNAPRCFYKRQQRYMAEVLNFDQVAQANFTRAAFEGSTHYALEGYWLAVQMIELFPWIKVVVSMRDPISQAISMVLHGMQNNWLLVTSCLEAHNNGTHPDFNGTYIYPCVMELLDEESRYATSLKPWLKHFPREQLHVIQYENITGAGMASVLRETKRFLGIDEALPSDDLGLYNYRHQKMQAGGWPMSRQNYLELVAKARRNTEEVVEIVRQYGFADADAWRRNWEAAWESNLNENCEPGLEGKCMIQVT